MFRRNSTTIRKNAIDTLIGSSTEVTGNVHFKDGLRIDGHVKGNIIASTGLLMISQNARVEGDVWAASLVVNGEIVGQVTSSRRLELQEKGRITGDVTYNLIEIRAGASIAGKLIHTQPDVSASNGESTASAMSGIRRNATEDQE